MKQSEIRRSFLFIIPLFFLIPLAASCSGGSVTVETRETLVAGDAARGEALYRQTVIGPASAPGCITCHSLEEGVALVGPSHAGIGSRAANAVSGLTAEAFLLESIIDPDANISDGYDGGVMYANYARDLTEQEIADLAAFLLSMK